MWWRWTLATMTGELLGFAVPAVLMPVAIAALQRTGHGTQAVVTLVLAVLAGIVEGASLGFAQALVLRRCILNLAWGEWVRNTAIAAGIAYIFGMLPSTLMDIVPLPVPILIASTVILALPLLVSIGFAQWLVLRRYVVRAGRWIWANAIAWVVGLAMPFIGLTLVPDNSPVAVFVAAGVASGVLMGATVGAITGITLVRLLKPRI